MRMALDKPIVHLGKELVLLLEPRRELRHVGVLRLVLEPDFGVSPYDVLNSAAVETHEHKVLELRVHRDRLVLLSCPAHVDAILRLAFRDDA